MEEPLILELHMGVGVEGALRREAVARRPVLPPVEIPKRTLERLRLLRPVQTDPVVPLLLIGTEQEAEIVDLETGGAAQIARLALNESAPTREQNLLGIPG